MKPHSRRLPRDRRGARRFPYAGVVAVGEMNAIGYDISHDGMAVVVAKPLDVGEVLRISLGSAWTEPALPEIEGFAEVVRSDPDPRGFRVGLRFVRYAKS